MPKITVNGASLYYEDSGSTNKEAIVFSHGLLFNLHMFDHQVAALRDRYRCIAYDHRGQGQSEVTRDGYDMETLYEDTVALMTALNAAPCHFVGLSMGGFMGMRLAARSPHLIKSLVLLETSADPEPSENVPRYRLLNVVARLFGPGVVADRVMKILFSKTFIHDPAREAERQLWRERISAGDRVGISRAVTGVIKRKGIYEELDRIRVPTLIMVGEEDVATRPERSERMLKAIRGAKLVLIPHAGHSSSIEAPEFVTRQIEAFIGGVG